MISIDKNKQKEMLEYLVSKLEKNYKNITPNCKEFFGIPTNYIKVDDGLLLIVDKGFLKKENRKIINILENIYITALKFTNQYYKNRNVAVIFYKDEKNFFRPAGPRHYYKIKKKLSMKNYTYEDMNKIIFFRPEEKFIYEKKGLIQYYQPKSQRLEEEIVSYRFVPIIFDYSHINNYEKYKLFNNYSQKDHMWINKETINTDVLIKNGLIISSQKACYNCNI